MVSAEKGLLVERDGQTGYVHLDDPKPYHRYRTTAVEVGSAKKFGRRFVDRFAVHLDELSANEQRAFERGLAEGEDEYGYVAQHDETPIPGYQGILTDLQTGEPLRRISQTGANGRVGTVYVYLVKREQSLYRVSILDS